MFVANLEELHAVLYGTDSPDGEVGRVQISKMVIVIKVANTKYPGKMGIVDIPFWGLHVLSFLTERVSPIPKRI